MTEEVYWHQGEVNRRLREKRAGHKSFVVWFTGLSASGKSTLAIALEKELFNQGLQVTVLDGDNVRHGLCSDLGFSPEDRRENLRRIGEAAKLFLESGTIVLAAFVSPCRADREQVRSMMPHGDFVEAYCQCDVDTCIRRDPKGLYAKAIKGKIPNFTGISAPYEEPLRPEITISSGAESVEDGVKKLITLLEDSGKVGI
ncbi:MAG TPA: adenylyl-sulfate kinase [Gammaproteobacteria bacterium]|nr:adenylyl-sulfate kinase [Gammaproteobacteria bacterium]